MPTDTCRVCPPLWTGFVFARFTKETNFSIVATAHWMAPTRRLGTFLLDDHIAAYPRTHSTSHREASSCRRYLSTPESYGASTPLGAGIRAKGQPPQVRHIGLNASVLRYFRSRDSPYFPRLASPRLSARIHGLTPRPPYASRHATCYFMTPSHSCQYTFSVFLSDISVRAKEVFTSDLSDLTCLGVTGLVS
jgi:hypothetical protein